MNNIKLFLLCTILCTYVYNTESFFLGGVGVVGGGWALAALLGIKAAAIGGLAVGAALSRGRGRGGRRSGRRYGGRRRFGRSVDDEDDMTAELLLEASLNDEYDCAKKLICILNAQDELDEDDAKVAHLFGKSGNIDVTSVTAEFDLAALMGQKAGESQCYTMYSRCPYQVKDLMEVIRQPQNLYNQL